MNLWSAFALDSPNFVELNPESHRSAYKLSITKNYEPIPEKVILPSL